MELVCISILAECPLQSHPTFSRMIFLGAFVIDLYQAEIMVRETR